MTPFYDSNDEWAAKKFKTGQSEPRFMSNVEYKDVYETMLFTVSMNSLQA